jgi:hypothetical protein
MKKSTHIGYRTELFMPITKTAEGKYMAVLSDDSTDRDDEIVSKECLRKLATEDEYLAALCNHSNDIFMMVADWRNKRVEEIDGYTAFIAEPYFYKSNPNAKIIMGMLDEGAKPGISIGAIVNDYEEMNNKRVYTDLEIVEASFVAIPSNRHGRAMAVAKKFDKTIRLKKEINGGIKVEKEFTQKDMDSSLEKAKSELNKQLEQKDAEISKLSEQVKEMTKSQEEKEAELAKVKTDSEMKLKELELEVEKTKNEALEKLNFSNNPITKDLKPEEVAKAFEAGKLPVMRL